ncbi:uncharacterized protein Z519_12223 [Cladophialophora bantiana CBS 173.52]|uniref:Uncharacterized protein n=1 Tax=Cladophialophora bantiana (strain ATCC 10958 / CBS 173.52 / CDC B-1940 / NIH 8579) TaxID=1442370 RepID=A0A0D2FK92_CLAB1|nr:uncharacterized protein Z519_12223 [Cladophialophora bantiana CBS 173.52]KIW87112.1 hypothetical protein Z519_12223 [Cladophialophora bantiana CBS 173.52]
MAGYPETDVLSAFVCCDPCAYHIANVGSSPLYEDLKAAIPTLVDLEDEANRETWTKSVDNVLHARFLESDYPQIRFAILDHARLSTARPGRDLLYKDVLLDVWRQASNQLRPLCLVNHGTKGQAANISDVVNHFLGDDIIDDKGLISDSTLESLQHPVDSFVLLLRSTTNLGINLGTRMIFMRLVLHMLEQCATLETDKFNPRRASAETVLESALKEADVSKVTVSSLHENGLIDDSAYNSSTSIGAAWTPVETTCIAAIQAMLAQLAMCTKIKKQEQHADDKEGLSNLGSGVEDQLPPIVQFTRWLPDDMLRTLCRWPRDKTIAEDYLGHLSGEGMVTTREVGMVAG